MTTIKATVVSVHTGASDQFPSGAELQLENFNPACLEMGTKLANTMTTRSGKTLENTDFSRASKLLRGVVGVVEVAGSISPGDVVEIIPYEHPSWLVRSSF